MSNHTNGTAAAAAIPPIVTPRPARIPLPLRDFRHDDLLRRIRSEYIEMPGLALTLGQAQRLWDLHGGDCERLLADLVDARFLARTALGSFVRADSGRAGA